MSINSSPQKLRRSQRITASSPTLRTPLNFLSIEERDELVNREEPLRKKHMRHLVGCDHGRLFLAHPFYCGPVVLTHCGVVHYEIDNMSALATDYLRKGFWQEYLECHTKPFLIAAFRKVLGKLGGAITDKDYWETVRWLYETNENPSGHWHTFRRWFAARRRDREYLMEPDERDLLRRLPDSFTVYRGYSRFRGEGMSWTLDRRVADWFAHRRADWGQPRVITGLVRRDDVLALLESAGEAEVLVPHGLVTQQVHGPAAEGEMPFSVFEYAKPRLDIESLCVRKPSRPGSRKRPASTPRKQTARSKLPPR
jgi:hypothetical protein